MGSSNILGKKRIEKIQKLSAQGLSVSEISGALHISKKIISEILGGKDEHIKNNESRKKNNENVKRGGPGDPQLSINESRSGSNNIPNEVDVTGEHGKNGSGGSKHNGIKNNKIVFIGGKKDMPKKEEKKEAEAENNSQGNKYQCGNCGAFFDEELDVCPSCGAELDSEAYD